MGKYRRPYGIKHIGQIGKRQSGAEACPDAVILSGAEILRGVREHVLPLIESGRIGVGLDRIFDMEEAAAAHEYFDSGQHRGKIVLRMV